VWTPLAEIVSQIQPFRLWVEVPIRKTDFGLELDLAQDYNPPVAMSLEITDWEKINACLLRLYRELDAEKHARTMLQVLNELVPADSSCLNYFEPPAKLRGITFPENFATAQQVEAVGNYSFQSPIGHYYTATQDASWKMISDFMPIEEFHKLDFHRLALAPLGINHQIGGILGIVDGVFHIITIHRTHHSFTEREREILNVLHPHLVTSFLNATFMGRANRSIMQLKAVMETAPGAYGYFKADGDVAWVQPRAQEWLLEFFPTEKKNNGNMPRSVTTLVQSSREEGGTPKSFTQHSATEFLILFLSMTAMGGWILRLERKPKINPPHFHPLPQLTPAENEVLRWMVEGKRNAEIGIILNSSPRTVEKHAAHILTGLDVENRATAIIRAMELAAIANQGKP
jgi:DNA-binding CsgD family transcriptional regulator